jgi:hypothetical protein
VNHAGRILSYGGDWGLGPEPGSGPGERLPHEARGVFSVGDAVTLYRSEEGAQWGYGLDATADRQIGGAHQDFSSLTAAGIGDQSIAFTYADTFSGRPVTVDVLDFRRGTYAVHVKLIAYADILDRPGAIDEMTYLGNLVDQRISALVHRPSLKVTHGGRRRMPVPAAQRGRACGSSQHA